MGKSVDKAKARVAELEETVGTWTARAAEKSVQADELEATIGEAALDSAEPDRTAAELTEQVLRLRTEARAATSTAEAAQRRLEEARRDVLRAEASEWREKAREQHKQADALEAKVARLLDELEQVEGIRYAPPETPLYAFGGAERIGTSTALGRSGQLRLEARRAEGRAVALEAEADGRPVQVPTGLLDGEKLYEQLAPEPVAA